MLKDCGNKKKVKSIKCKKCKTQIPFDNDHVIEVDGVHTIWCDNCEEEFVSKKLK